MNQYRSDSMSVVEYFQIRENSDALLEYIDGFVYMSPSQNINVYPESLRTNLGILLKVTHVSYFMRYMILN